MGQWGNGESAGPCWPRLIHAFHCRIAPLPHCLIRRGPLSLSRVVDSGRASEDRPQFEAFGKERRQLRPELGRDFVDDLEPKDALVDFLVDDLEVWPRTRAWNAIVASPGGWPRHCRRSAQLSGNEAKTGSLLDRARHPNRGYREALGSSFQNVNAISHGAFRQATHIPRKKAAGSSKPVSVARVRRGIQYPLPHCLIAPLPH